MFHVKQQKIKNTKHKTMSTNTNTVEEKTQDVKIVETMEGNNIPREDASWCSYYEEYTQNPTWHVYTKHGSLNDPVNYSEAAISELSDELIYHEESQAYYYRRNIWRHELTITNDTGRLMYQYDAFLWEDGEYYESEEQNKEDEELYRREYHEDKNPYFHRFTGDKQPRFFIGYEIEKEDREALQCIRVDSFEQLHPKWRKESDGSLDRTGFELISPAFELNAQCIREYIEERPLLVKHINANKSERCGGHINVSEDGLTGRELFDRVKGYTPLFHALYYKRIDKTYTKAKSNEDLKHGDKYQSIRIHNNRIELRIISAVPNVDTLIWRTRLIEHMLNNQTEDPRQVFFDFCDETSPLYSLIVEQYPTQERREAVRARLIEYTRRFEGIDLTSEKK